MELGERRPLARGDAPVPDRQSHSPREELGRVAPEAPHAGPARAAEPAEVGAAQRQRPPPPLIQRSGQPAISVKRTEVDVPSVILSRLTVPAMLTRELLQLAMAVSPQGGLHLPVR